MLWRDQIDAARAEGHMVQLPRSAAELARQLRPAGELTDATAARSAATRPRRQQSQGLAG